MHVLEASERFDVSWPNPAMAGAPWVGDRMHFPSPTIPLAQRIIGEFQEKVLGAPTLFVNGYQFSLPPNMPPPPAEVVERGLAVWHEDYSPRIRAYCRRVREIDFEPMSLAETAREFERLVAEGTDMLRLTMVVVGTFTQPSYQMLGFLETELGEDGPILSGTLLQGFQNESAASGSTLSELVTMASRSPQLAEAARAGDLAAAASAPGGPEFISRLDEFLDDYGWRAETWGSMHLPTWGEHPEAVLAMVARYLADPEGSLDDQVRRAGEQRVAALAEVESRLSSEKLPAFRRQLEDAQAHVAVSEDRARWQLSVVGVLRIPALALGRKLVAAGALDEASDIFYLTWDEAMRAVAEPGEWARERARAGRTEFDRWQQLSPPPFLGTMPDMSLIPPEMLPMLRHFVGLRMPEVSEGVVKGAAASRGTVTGRARVIRHLDESDKLEPGDVMVCVTTAPPWTALFAIAGAVVTDTGGVMSHSGICAREFAIPCVVGTQIGTSVIPDGAMVTVDGEAGTVAILPG